MKTLNTQLSNTKSKILNTFEQYKTQYTKHSLALQNPTNLKQLSNAKPKRALRNPTNKNQKTEHYLLSNTKPNIPNTVE